MMKKVRKKRLVESMRKMKKGRRRCIRKETVQRNVERVKN